MLKVVSLLRRELSFHTPSFMLAEVVSLPRRELSFHTHSFMLAEVISLPRRELSSLPRRELSFQTRSFMLAEPVHRSISIEKENSQKIKTTRHLYTLKNIVPVV